MFLANSNALITERYTCDDCGGSMMHDGSTEQPYQYVGKLGYYDEPDIDLQYLRARWYNPSTGRFISEDPLLTL